MNLHLFSTPGKDDDIRYILEACRPYLDGKDDPVVAYLPAASLSSIWQEDTEKAFCGLARVETISTELMTLPEMEAILRNAALVYIPGGNTFLLNHRLHISKIIDYLRKKVTAGLPVVAFSAGAVLCGPNILTSNNINIVPSSYFKGLEATPFNFNVHYPEDPLARPTRDDWLGEYHTFHDNPGHYAGRCRICGSRRQENHAGARRCVDPVQRAGETKTGTRNANHCIKKVDNFPQDSLRIICPSWLLECGQELPEHAILITD